jgi:hypothetical protein
MDYSRIRGFNYQPSYGSNGFELWQKFNRKTIEVEIGRGKKYFPQMNAVRLWLSWDSFIRNPDRFTANFDETLDVADKHNLAVMPVLFNRWHISELDYGGIYIDNFLPGASWVQSENMFLPFLEAIVGPHAGDPRIFMWDLCNEPFSYGDAFGNASLPSEFSDIEKSEFAWLQATYDTCKRLGALAPICVGIHPLHKLAGIQRIEPISDVLTIHPYWTADSPPHERPDYEELLDGYVAFANAVKKPLLATETCWGSLDDAKRVGIIRYTLGELKKRGIGWLAYLLHHSLIADAHRPEFGPVGVPGNLSFIEADGRLRRGHEVFNDF